MQPFNCTPSSKNSKLQTMYFQQACCFMQFGLSLFAVLCVANWLRTSSMQSMGGCSAQSELNLAPS